MTSNCQRVCNGNCNSSVKDLCSIYGSWRMSSKYDSCYISYSHCCELDYSYCVYGVNIGPCGGGCSYDYSFSSTESWSCSVYNWGVSWYCSSTSSSYSSAKSSSCVIAYSLYISGGRRGSSIDLGQCYADASSSALSIYNACVTENTVQYTTNYTYTSNWTYYSTTYVASGLKSLKSYQAIYTANNVVYSRNYSINYTASQINPKQSLY